MRVFAKNFLILLILLTSSATAYAKWTHPLDYKTYQVADGVKKIFKHALTADQRQAHIGIIIQSMKSKKVLYQKNANRLFTPASVQKLLTAVAALDYLKPSYIFHTQLLSKGKIINQKLQGNLTVKFSGDPELTDTDLQQLFHQLHKKGIKQITGNIYIDNFDYGVIPYPPGWIWDDLSYSFAAPLNAIIIDRNYFVLHIISPKKKASRPLLKTDLPKGIVSFNNALMLVNTAAESCPIGIYSNDSNHYKLSGCFYRKWKQQARKLAIRNITAYAKAIIRLTLRENKIKYTGEITIRKTPKGAKNLAKFDSEPLSDIVKQMLKDSDNLTTNAVLKKLGETYYRSRGTWQNSLRALKLLLTKPTGINFKNNLINDGAGLSRYNLLTPRQLSKLLYFAYHKKSISDDFMAALPIGGKDGTMKYRLQKQRRGKRVLAKTGSMTGITALAGYVKTKHNGVVSFVIMMNGFIKPRRPYIAFEDNICRLLVNAKKS